MQRHYGARTHPSWRGLKPCERDILRRTLTKSTIEDQASTRCGVSKDASRRAVVIKTSVERCRKGASIPRTHLSSAMVLQRGQSRRSRPGLWSVPSSAPSPPESSGKNPIGRRYTLAPHPARLVGNGKGPLTRSYPKPERGKQNWTRISPSMAFRRR
jgi:hypothetical protein